MVGASGHLLQENFGPEIDSHEAIVRFNWHPASPFDSVGTRTTVRIVSPTETLRLLNECAYGSSNQSKSPLQPDLAFVTFLNDPDDLKKFVEARKNYPEAQLLLLSSDVVKKNSASSPACG